MDPSLLAEFATPEEIVRAAQRMRARGVTRMNSYTPFHLPELEEALGTGRSRIPIGVFLGGLTGASVAFLILWYTNAINFPLDVGGHPLNSFVSDIPIMFETTVLFAGITSFVLALVLNGLPRLHRPIMEVGGIERTTIDRYWLEIATSDPRWEEQIEDELTELGAVAFHRRAARSS